MDKRTIRDRYDRLAKWYDLGIAISELLFLRRLRRRLLRPAAGRVLELAVGTGRNLPFYPPICDVTAVDLSAGMLRKARNRIEAPTSSVELLQMDGENLGFQDSSFDTVVNSLTLCTYPDPVAALREMGRVCRAGGVILLLEHGRSTRRVPAWLQDRTAAWHAKYAGCHWNREPLDLVRAAGLEVVSVGRTFFGVFHVIEARPPE